MTKTTNSGPIEIEVLNIYSQINDYTRQSVKIRDGSMICNNFRCLLKQPIVRFDCYITYC